MDWLNEYSNLLLVFFTLVLAGATVRLWRATTRYRKATERYADISEKQFTIEGMRHLERLLATAHPAGDPEVIGALKEAVTGMRPGEQPSQEAQDELRDWFMRYYKGLLEQMKAHLEKEFPSSS